MPTTPNYALRYPAGTSANDVVTDVQNLATDVDTVLNAQLPALSVVTRQTTVLAAPAASVTFSSIPSTLRAVQVFWSARGDTVASQTTIQLRINGDSSTNYSGQFVTGFGSTASAGTFVTQSSANIGTILAASATSGRVASGDIMIPGWDAHSKMTGMARSGAFDVAGSNSWSTQTAFLYEAASPFTSITFMPLAGNFVVSSEFTLVGWK